MKVLYESGQTMPPQTFDAILFTAKTGLMTLSLWTDHFGSGNTESRRKTFQRLRERRIFERHPNSQATNIFVLGQEGIRYLQDQGFGYAPSPYVAQVDHDLFLAETALQLEAKGYCDEWKTEAELKVAGSRAYAIQSQVGGTKYPDLLLTQQTASNRRTVAIELEMTQKSERRYREVIHAYERMEHLSWILFITKTESIRSAIERTLRLHGSAKLRERMVFTSTEAWRVDPDSAPLANAGRTTNFAKLMETSSGRHP